MATVTLTISGRGKTWHTEPNPKGTIIASAKPNGRLSTLPTKKTYPKSPEN